MAETTARPRIVVLVGLPGSGKSTWVRGFSGVLSSDALRELLADDPADQNIHARVFRAIRYLLKHRLELKRPVTYIDATNLTPAERWPYIKMARLFDGEIEAVFFDLPLEECLRRNRERSRIVPDQVLAGMSEKLIAPAVAEGFARVTTVGDVVK